ncbi:hypothetical protein K469DRAFT_481642, partial [Zopfia rhizophila CBS 207.26]
QRWYEFADSIGWGSLCLIPYDQVTDSWVEQKLLAGEWHIWLELIKKVNSDVYTASKAFDAWLGSESIASSIDGKRRLCIEAELSKTTYEVEGVPD